MKITAHTTHEDEALPCLADEALLPCLAVDPISYALVLMLRDYTSRIRAHFAGQKSDRRMT